MKQEDYIVIQGWMVSELGLKGNELIIFALIHGFCKDGEHKFTGSINYISEWANISSRSVISILQKLVEKKLLLKEERFVNNVKICTYKTGSEKTSRVVKFFQGGSEKTSQGGSEKTSHNKLYIKPNIEYKKKDLLKVSQKKEQNFVPPTIDEVAAYIQEKGYHFNAEMFVSFYESKGWMIGRNKMKDWKAACRTWEGKRKEQEPSLFSQPQFPPNPRHGDRFGNNEWFYSDEEKRWIKNGEVDRRGRTFIVQVGKWCV